MSEWISVLAVFWALWACDGLRLSRERRFTLVGGTWHRRATARVSYSRFSFPGILPHTWRIVSADVPISVSPAGISNCAGGAMGRPVETPSRPHAWRWPEIREVGVAKGWIFINGQQFCRDTGHASARQLIELIRLEPAARERTINAWLDSWFRPATLRRRMRVLTARTRVPAMLNVMSLVLFAGLTAYIAGGLAERFPARWSAAAAALLPWLLVGLLGLHVAGIISAWRTLRRLKPVGLEKRGANLLSALLMPPQAMRLRALLAEGFFPPSHPLAVVIAFAADTKRKESAFNVLADIRWPLGPDASSVAREVSGWFGAALEARVGALLKPANLSSEMLFAAPLADTPASCSYCPRCRDQFVAGRTLCPHGIPLRPLRLTVS